MSQTSTPADPRTAVHVSFLLDRSGSMNAIRADVIGGFNQFLREQQARPGECRMTLVQFDSQAPFEVLTDAARVQDVPQLDAGRYEPRSGTPLLDALGTLLDHAERRARGRDEDPVVVVFTDGEENSSHTWTRASLFERIKGLEAKGWAFVFLGANQDSYAEAGALGFAAGSTSNWAPGTTKEAFQQMSRSIGAYRLKEKAARVSQSVDFFEGVREAEAPTTSDGRKKPTKH
jgi:Mg-chelatase subunit ChlD